MGRSVSRSGEAHGTGLGRNGDPWRSRVTGEGGEEAAANADREVRLEHVQRMKRVIAAGSYRISALHLAESLMQYMLETP
jgi:hypothetical protein